MNRYNDWIGGKCRNAPRSCSLLAFGQKRNDRGTCGRRGRALSIFIIFIIFLIGGDATGVADYFSFLHHLALKKDITKLATWRASRSFICYLRRYCFVSSATPTRLQIIVLDAYISKFVICLFAFLFYTGRWIVVKRRQPGSMCQSFDYLPCGSKFQGHIEHNVDGDTRHWLVAYNTVFTPPLWSFFDIYNVCFKFKYWLSSKNVLLK